MGAKTAKPKKKAAPTPEVRAHAPPLPAEEYVGKLPIEHVRPSPDNPRKTFDDIDGLAESIRVNGLLQRILVRPVGPAKKPDYFEVVCGERRLRAMQLLGCSDVPVAVRTLADAEARPLRHAENEQRADVKLSETATAYAKLAETMTDAEVAAAVGKPLAYVRDLVRLARLPAWALAAVDAGTLPRATAGLVARVPGEAAREKAAAQVLTGTDDWGTGNGYEQTLAKLRAGKTPAEIYHNWYGPKSFREAKEVISRDHTRQLKGAPFSLKMLYEHPDTTDEEVRYIESCDVCPRRAGNDPEAKADGVRADVCLDPDCYRQKLDAHLEQERARFRKRFKMEPDADVNPDGVALTGERPARGWLDWNGTVGGSEIAEELLAGRPKLATRKVSEVVLECPMVHGCQPCLVFDEKSKPHVLVKTADVRKTLVAAEVLKKPERKPAVPKSGSNPSKGSTPENPGAPAGGSNLATAKPLLANAIEVQDRTALVAADRCRTMLLANAESLAALSACGGPDTDAVYQALTLAARAIVYDWLEYGDNRRDAVVRFIPAAGTGNKNKDRTAADTAIAAMTPAEVVGLILALTAHVAATNEHHWGRLFVEEFLDYADTNTADCEEQAKRELVGGETAEQAAAADQPLGKCRVCGCTDHDCSQCIAKTGQPCSWVEPDLCSACVPTAGDLKLSKVDRFPADVLAALDRKGVATLGKLLELADDGSELVGSDPRAALYAFVRKIPGVGKESAAVAADAVMDHLHPKAPPPASVMLSDLDVPAAVFDLLAARPIPLTSAGATWACCEFETPELASLPPRNRLMAWLVKLGASAKHASEAAAAIAAALDGSST